MPPGVEHGHKLQIDSTTTDPITVSMPPGVEHYSTVAETRNARPADHRLDASGR